MKKGLFLPAVMLTALLCVPQDGWTEPEGGSPSTGPAGARPLARPSTDYGKIPLQFIPNRGQSDDRVAFYVTGRDTSVYFASDGLTFDLGRDNSARWAVKLDFVEPNEGVRPIGLETSGAVISYFKGRPKDWRTGLPACARIIYRELWPGIDVIYSGTYDRMKYEFVVRPGADPSRIRLAYRGASRVAATSEGRIAVETPAGSFQDDIPVAYQETADGRIDVPVAYSFDDAAADGQIQGGAVGYGFRVGAYDRSQALIIDPDLLVYCGFVGGAGADSVVAAGTVIAGTTSSTELTFPVTAGPDLTYNGGDSDVFVAKLNESGTALDCCFYIGGSGQDVATGLASSWPRVFVTGYTNSAEDTFPVTGDLDQTYNGGETDAFVACVDLLESKLAFCGYIGGSGRDEAAAIAYQSELYQGDPGALCIAGWTSSMEATFPVKIGPDMTYNGGESDAFVAEMDPADGHFYYCGYIGGSERERASAVKYPPPIIDIWTGEVYFWGHPCVVGWTSSTEASFPVLGGPDLTYNGGDSDAFVARLETYGRFLDFCGFIGGAGSDQASGVYCKSLSDTIWYDASSITYIAGTTSSTEATFPVANGPDLTYNGGDSDAFIFRMDGLTLTFGGYIGGAGTDVATGLGKGYNDAFLRVVGYTSSTEATFPVKWGPDLTYNGGPSDAFIAEVNDDYVGFQLRRCGYIGGAGSDRALALSVTSGQGIEEAYVAGVTDSSEMTFPVSAGPDLAYNGGESDGFVARIAKVRPALSSFTPSYAPAGSPGLELIIRGTDFADGAKLRWGGWDGHDLATEFVDDSELHAAIAAPDLAAGRAVDVSVTNPDGTTSDSRVFEVRNPIPTLTSISPVRATAGGADFKLAVLGTGFLPDASVLWNGASRWTTYMSGTELQADVLASDLAVGGEYQVTVSNPAPNEGASNAFVFRISSFAMAPSPQRVTVTAGESAAYTIELTPQFGSFDAPVFFACSGLPGKCTASFSPSSVTPGGTAATTTLTLATKAASPQDGAAIAASLGEPPSGLGPSGIVLPAFLALLVIASARRRRRAWAPAALLACLVILLTSCATETREQTPYNGTPRGTHTITVSGISGGMTVSTVVQLEVK